MTEFVVFTLTWATTEFNVHQGFPDKSHIIHIVVKSPDVAVVSTRDRHRRFVTLDLTDTVKLVYMVPYIHKPTDRHTESDGQTYKGHRDTHWSHGWFISHKQGVYKECCIPRAGKKYMLIIQNIEN